jgi:hypothetical protein
MHERRIERSCSLLEVVFLIACCEPDVNLVQDRNGI